MRSEIAAATTSGSPENPTYSISGYSRKRENLILEIYIEVQIFRVFTCNLISDIARIPTGFENQGYLLLCRDGCRGGPFVRCDGFGSPFGDSLRSVQEKSSSFSC